MMAKIGSLIYFEDDNSVPCFNNIIITFLCNYILFNCSKKQYFAIVIILADQLKSCETIIAILAI